MPFILTKFVYPLKNKLELQKEVYFDNPRTKEEINRVVKVIKEASPFPPNDRLAGGEGYITIDYIISKMKEKYIDDTYVNEYIDNCKYKDPFYKIASMWVILRVENGQDNVYDFNRYVEKGHILIDTLTILAFDPGQYVDFSILISDEFSIMYEEEMKQKTQHSIVETLLEVTNKKQKKIKNSEYRFNGFLNYYKEILKINNKLSSVTNSELIEYIMESIQAFRKNHDLKMKFVSVVSIIELLLTHSPDFARFNGEESISRQFNNKIALICYLRDRTVKYDDIIKESRLIYTLRSDIAHGNFNKFPKNLQKYFNFCKELEYTSLDSFDSIAALNILITRTLNYMLTILKSYLDDNKLCEIVKMI